MCESTVYILVGGKKNKVMDEAAKVAIAGTDVLVTSLAGERKTVENAELAEADLMRHEIVLRPRKR